MKQQLFLSRLNLLTADSGDGGICQNAFQAMKKVFFLLFFLLLGTVQLCQAQADKDFTPEPLDPEYLAALAEDCPSPSVLVNAVVVYSGYAKAYLEIAGMEDGHAIYLRDMEEGSLSPVSLTDGGGLLLPKLGLEKTYELVTTNHCGKSVTFGQIDTKTGKKDAIEVSTRLYEAIVAFQHGDTDIPLTKFLEDLPDITFYEKVAFLQQYYLGGKPLEKDSDTELPTGPTPPKDSCNCRFVFNTVQTASPATLNTSGAIDPDIQKVDKTDLCADYSKYWWVRQSRGAAKWHCVWTEGSKAGGDICNYPMSMINSSGFSPYYGQLRYNLLCTNYVQVPRECTCEKPLQLYYQYNTDVEAFAQRHTEGLGEKKAYAAAEDVAVALLHYDGTNTVKVLRSNGARAEAVCELTANPAFWSQVLKIAGAVAPFFLNSGDPQYTTLINSLVDQITPIFSIPYHDKDTCSQAHTTGTLFRGDTLIYLTPNHAVDLDLYSLSNLDAGGKRSWFSYARANSDFYLVGYVPGGLLDDKSPTCCTRKVANWVFASDGPHSTEDLRGEVGAILGVFAPWPIPTDPLSGIAKIPTQYGWMAQSSDKDCDGIIINGGGHGKGDGRSVESIHDAEGMITVFDMSGRVLYRNSYTNDTGDLRLFLREKQIAQNAGLYLVQTIIHGQKEIHKVFIN